MRYKHQSHKHYLLEQKIVKVRISKALGIDPGPQTLKLVENSSIVFTS